MTICVFGTAHAFDPDEVIFELEMKNDTPCYDLIQKQTNCFCCQSKFKKPVTCEFCAMKYCADCRSRQREFPHSIELENGEKLNGKICKICDRKFLMLDQYKRLMMPSLNRDEDLAHLIESYSMKIQKGEYLQNEEAKLVEDLSQKQSEVRLEQRRVKTSADLHADSIKRGDTLLRDIAGDMKLQMAELSKDRSQLDDADLDLQYLQGELVHFRDRLKRQYEEEQRQLQYAQMQESLLTDEQTDTSQIESSLKSGELRSRRLA